MKKINTIDTHSLTNGAHYNFMEAIYTNLNSILLYGEKLSTELPAFIQNCARQRGCRAGLESEKQ